MAIVNELALLSIVMLLAEHYPVEVRGKVILNAIGRERVRDVEKSLAYLLEKQYIATTANFLGMVNEPGTKIAVSYFRLTGTGVDYLDQYNRDLAEKIKEMKRKSVGFKPDVMRPQSAQGK